METRVVSQVHNQLYFFRMRLTSKCALLLPMFGICCAALTQAPQQPTITIGSKDLTVQPGHPIQIRIVLKNTTGREFTVFRSTGGASGEAYYSISVIGPDGNSAAYTEYGAAMEKNRHQIVPLSSKMVTVAPGEAVDDNVTVSRMFDVTAAGTYVIQASRASPLDPAVILKSNTLTISVGN